MVATTGLVVVLELDDLELELEVLEADELVVLSQAVQLEAGSVVVVLLEVLEAELLELELAHSAHVDSSRL